MTKIIGILIVLGLFEVAVDTSKEYLVANYPDTEIGVTEFLTAIRAALETERAGASIRVSPTTDQFGNFCRVQSRQGLVS